jgi:hypothetical protein
MTLNPQELQQIDVYLDRHHDLFEKLGRQFHDAFGSERRGQVSSQVRNLQQVAVSAPRFSDIEDFVKNQMGKQSGGTSEKWRQVGKATLDQLAELEKQAAQIATTPEDQLEARLRLARGWVRAVVSEYLYARAEAELKEAT